MNGDGLEGSTSKTHKDLFQWGYLEANDSPLLQWPEVTGGNFLGVGPSGAWIFLEDLVLPASHPDLLYHSLHRPCLFRGCLLGLWRPRRLRLVFWASPHPICFLSGAEMHWEELSSQWNLTPQMGFTPSQNSNWDLNPQAGTRTHCLWIEITYLV